MSIWFSGNGTVPTTTVHVHVSNDLFNQSFLGSRVQLRVINWQTGVTSVGAEFSAPTLAPASGAEIFAGSLADVWAKGTGCRELNDCFVWSSATSVDKPALDDALGFPVQFANVSLRHATVVVSEWKLGVGGVVTFVATSDAVAPYTSFYAGPLGHFSPNSVVLMPGVSQRPLHPATSSLKSAPTLRRHFFSFAVRFGRAPLAHFILTAWV